MTESHPPNSHGTERCPRCGDSEVSSPCPQSSTLGIYHLEDTSLLLDAHYCAMSGHPKSEFLTRFLPRTPGRRQASPRPAYPCTCYLYSSSSLLTYRSSLPPTYLPNYLSPSLPSTCLPVISVYLSSSFKYADLPIISTYHLPTHPPAHLPSTGLLLGRQGLIWV